MKVILLQELRGRGGEGDVITVADGFANNYLLRQGIAVRATKGELKQLEQRRGAIAKREEKRIADAEALKAQLDSTVVPIEAQVGEEGVLFGSVTAPIIADAIQATLGVEVDRKRIELKNPIKTAGEHEVAISLYREIKAIVKLNVQSAEGLAAEAETEVEAEKEAPVVEEAAVEAEEEATEEAAE